MVAWESLGIEIPPNAAGPEVSTTCPKCSGERKKKNVKCVSVNIEKGLATCHHCGWSASLSGKQERLNPAWNRPQFRPPPEREEQPLSARALEFFRKRGISEARLKANRVSTCVAYMPQLEEQVECIAFPYFRNGVLVNRKYRGPEKSFRMDTGAERILYNLDSITSDWVVICEGEIDCLSIQEAGFASCVSVPDGAPAETTKDYSSKFAFLDSDGVKEKLDAAQKIILAVDNDGPGKKLEDELARRLGRERCVQVEWPTGCKDANDVLVRNGVDDLRDAIESAKPYPLEGVFSALGELSRVYALYDHGHERGQSTGWESLDECYTVRPGEFTVVTGVPSSGKSNWLDAMLVKLAALHGWSFALFSPENQPIHDHVARIAEKFIDRPFDDGPTLRMSREDLKVGVEWAERHFHWMLPDDEANWNMNWILSNATALVRRYGIRGLVIDPWNELEASRPKEESETEYISRVLRIVRQWARRNGVHVWMVVHPVKLYREKNGEYPVPTLYDCAGSSHWRNKADNGICVWRDLNPEHTTSDVAIFIQKIRFRQIGKLGKVVLRYNKATANYTDDAEPWRSTGGAHGGN